MILIKTEKEDLEKKDKENVEKINNLNITIDNMSKEISNLKLKLLKSNNESNANDMDNKQVEDLEKKVKEQKSKIESLLKQTIDLNKKK